MESRATASFLLSHPGVRIDFASFIAPGGIIGFEGIAPDELIGFGATGMIVQWRYR